MLKVNSPASLGGSNSLITIAALLASSFRLSGSSRLPTATSIESYCSAMATRSFSLRTTAVMARPGCEVSSSLRTAPPMWPVAPILAGPYN